MTAAERSGNGERPRFLFLGASNIRLGWRPLLQAARDVAGGPFDAHLVMGHGRSLGRPTRFFGTSFSGLLHSVAWESLERASDQPTFVLLTDIGNDVLYGETPQQIVEWVDQMVRRAARISRAIVVTHLPVESIERLPKWRFLLLRNILWPSSQVSYTKALSVAREVDCKLAECVSVDPVAWVRTDPRWFGIDPVHVRRRWRRTAWRTYLAPWRERYGSNRAAMPARTLKPPRRLPRAIHHAAQYGAYHTTLRDGTTIRYYVG